MTRQAFLKQLSVGAAFALTVPCLYQCGKDDDGESNPNPGPTDVDFTIDVAADPYAAQLAADGFTVANEIVIARLADGSYAAASQECSHQRFKTVEYNAAADRWQCFTHGAQFATASGSPLNEVTDNPLTIYETTLTGTVLRVTS